VKKSSIDFKTLIIGLQMLFVAFGALVLVSLLTGLDPSIALFTTGSTVVILTEPQIWYNVWENLNLGGEVEIINNFLPGTDGFQFKPTLGFKWVF
jgi:hypothetical protein